MKIVIVVTYSYPYIGSGIGNVAMKQAEELAKRGHKVTLISSNFPKYKNKFVRNKVKYLKGNVLLRMEKIGLPIPLFFLTKNMKNAIKEADIVHIHDSLYPSSYQITRYAKKHNKKIILTQHIGFVDYHGFFYRTLSKIVYKTMAKKIIDYSKKIIVLNNKVKEDIFSIEASTGKIYTLPNGVDTNLFKPITQKKKKELRKKYNLALNKPIILFVGRLVAVKAFERLFEARDKDYLILFVGGGEIPENMKNDKSVKFIGEIDQEKVSEFYQLSDVFCLPSKSEGFPLSVLEAMATNIPVIATDLPIYKEYFKHNEILTINPTPENIKKTIRQILIKKSNIKTRKLIIKKFSWDKNVKNLINIYRSLG